MKAFICRELQQCVEDGIGILLPEVDAVRLFGGELKLSWIADVPQEHQRPRLVLNLLTQPDEGTPSVNETTDSDIAPDSMQFGCTLPHILQSIWEEDPVKGTVLVYNMDFMDAYDCGTFRMDQVVSFA